MSKLDTYTIVADTNADLPSEYITSENLECLYYPFAMDGEFYDQANSHKMYGKDFFDKLRSGSVSVTQQANPFDIQTIYEKILLQGKDVIHICFSSNLSGTYNSALIARDELLEKYPDRKIFVIDSLAASMGLGLNTYYVVEKAKEGVTVEELALYAEKLKLTVNHYFTVDDLNFLHRGGRVSKTAAVVGSILGVKPVLRVNNEGKLVPYGKERGRKNAIQSLLNKLDTDGNDISNNIVMISHGDCYDEIVPMIDYIENKYHPKKIMTNMVGSSIGSHSGPGTIALFFIGKPRVD